MRNLKIPRMHDIFIVRRKMDKKKLLTRIVTNPQILVGKPIIKGTRLAVEHILDLLGEGMTIEEIIREHTQLTKEDILASILFAQEIL